ncbi:MAG: hypothetical protein GX994_07195 [Firmicutes bacterium]|nr:hypothetical protein [Bacillota bacterium]
MDKKGGRTKTWALITYDGRGRPLEIETKDNSYNEIFFQSYTYDNVNNITRINDEVAGATQSFTYDQLNRLRTAAYVNPNNTLLNYSYR